MIPIKHISKQSKKFFSKKNYLAKHGFFLNGLDISTELHMFFSQLLSIIEYCAAFPSTHEIADRLEKPKLSGLRTAADSNSQVAKEIILYILHVPTIYIRLVYLCYRALFNTQMKFPELITQLIPFVQKTKVHARLPTDDYYI